MICEQDVVFDGVDEIIVDFICCFELQLVQFVFDFWFFDEVDLFLIIRVGQDDDIWVGVVEVCGDGIGVIIIEVEVKCIGWI